MQVDRSAYFGLDQWVEVERRDETEDAGIAQRLEGHVGRPVGMQSKQHGVPRLANEGLASDNGGAGRYTAITCPSSTLFSQPNSDGDSPHEYCGWPHDGTLE